LISSFKYTWDDNLINYSQTGFTLADQSFQVVDEAIIELSAYQICINFWKNYPSLKIYTERTEDNSQLSCLEECYLILLILDDICAQTGKTFPEMLNIIQKSILTNPQDGLDFLASHMEQYKFELLKNIKGLYTFETDDLFKQMLIKFEVWNDFLRNYNGIKFCIWDKLSLHSDLH